MYVSYILVTDAPPDHYARAWLTVAVLCFSGLTASLTQTMVIPLQGELPQLLDTTVANAGWVVTVTLLAGAVSMPISGRLGDLYGKQRVLVTTAAMLVVGSVLCGLADSLVPMLAGRALQGLAMGFIPVGIALMREVTPPEVTGSAIAAMSATLGVGGAIGLPLSAWVAQSFDWHAVFWMSAVLAGVMTALVVWLVPAVRDAHPGRLDVPGALGLTAGLVAVLVGVSKGSEWGWSDPRTLGAIVAGVLVLLAWGRFELDRPDALCDLRATSRRPVLLTNLAAVAIGFGMMAQAVVVPQLLQLPEATGFGLGQTILEAGLWMAPGGLMMMVFAPLSSRLMSLRGPRVALALGGLVLGAGYLVAFFLMEAPWELALACCIVSAGVGIAYAAMPTLILGSTRLEEAGSAVGINALSRSIGTTTAAAVMTTVLAGSADAFGVPSRGAYETCFLIGAIAAFVGVAITLLVPKPARTAPAAEATRAADGATV